MGQNQANISGGSKGIPKGRDIALISQNCQVHSRKVGELPISSSNLLDDQPFGLHLTCVQSMYHPSFIVSGSNLLLGLTMHTWYNKGLKSSTLSLFYYSPRMSNVVLKLKWVLSII